MLFYALLKHCSVLSVDFSLIARFSLLSDMGKKKFVKTPKLPQAQSAEEIEQRDALHEAKANARAGSEQRAGALLFLRRAPRISLT